MKNRRWLLLPLIVGFGLAAQGQRADGVYHISCIVQMVDASDGTKKADCTTHPRADAVIGINGKVSFEITTTQQLMDEEGAPEVTDLVLFVDGQALPGTHPAVEGQRDELLPNGSSEEEENTDAVVTFRVTFPVTRELSSEKGKESWKKLMGGLSKNRKQVPVSVGLINGPPLPSSYKAEFVRLSGRGLTAFIVIALILGIGFFLVAAKTGALRDKEPSPKANSLDTIQPPNRAYSLSRTQVALWTLIVVYAYLFIWLITGEYNTEIPRTILAILGLSAGTFSVAASIDRQKVTDAEKADKNNPGTAPQVPQNQVSPTDGLVPDLFSSSGGAALHRVQFGVWTVALMIVFVASVYDTLAMPQFDAGLLGLMGISSAAYAGMKIPENKK